MPALCGPVPRVSHESTCGLALLQRGGPAEWHHPTLLATLVPCRKFQQGRELLARAGEHQDPRGTIHTEAGRQHGKLLRGSAHILGRGGHAPCTALGTDPVRREFCGHSLLVSGMPMTFPPCSSLSLIFPTVYLIVSLSPHKVK